MKIVKNLSPIMESISNVGKNKRKMLDEDFDVNHPIGVLPHADAVATEQHIADRAAGLERRANPDKDPLVKELIDETASEKSRTLHYDIVDRKGLAKILTEAKKNKQKFKVGKSDKVGYRYFVDILPIYGSKGALEVDDDVTQVDGEEAGESLSESLTLNEDIEKDLRDYIKWCKDNGKEAKDGKSLDAYFAMKDKNTKKLDEAKYKISMSETEDYDEDIYYYLDQLDRLELDDDAYYYYKEKLEDIFYNDDHSIYKSPSDVIMDAQETSNQYSTEEDINEGCMKKSRKNIDEELKLYSSSIQDFEPSERAQELWDEIVSNGKLDDLEYQLEVLYPNGLSEDALDDLLVHEEDWIRDLLDLYEDDNSEDEDLDEDLQLYASSLKDFKPAKEAEGLWNEIIEKGKLDDLEYELENVFKSDTDKNTSIDIQGLNDLLVNHPDFIRTLIGLDDAPLEDDDYDDDVDPVDNDSLIVDDDDEEPVENGTPIESDDDEDVIDYETDKIDSDDEDDIKPLTDAEPADDAEEYPEAPHYVDEKSEGEKKPFKWTKREDDGEDKVEESLTGREEKQRKINALRAKLKEDCECAERCDKEPELKFDDEDDDLEECDEPINECDTSKDDELTEKVADAFVKSRSRVTEAAPSDRQAEYDSLVKKTLPLLESDEEVVDISDDTINEMIGAPTEADVKKECKECDEKKPVEDKKPLEESCEEKKEEIKEKVEPAEEPAKEEGKVEECKEQPIKEECKNEETK